MNRYQALVVFPWPLLLAPALAQPPPRVPDIAAVKHDIPGMYLGTLRTLYADADRRIDVVMAGAFAKADSSDEGSGQIRIYRNVSRGIGDILNFFSG